MVFPALSSVSGWRPPEKHWLIARHVTTAWVRTEVADAIARLANRSVFLEFLAALERNPAADIVPATLAGANQSHASVRQFSTVGDTHYSTTTPNNCADPAMSKLESGACSW